MSAGAFLATSLLLGAFVLCAGIYGLLYGAARLRQSVGLLRAAVLACGVLCLIAAAVVVATPLEAAWKALIVASALVYCAIPPVTWRYLQRTHRDHGANT
jgi:uncharacterized membrane protein HdeD (DUF308 family)